MSYDKVKEAMENFKDVDMAICLGDLVDDCGNDLDNVLCLQRISDMIHSFGIPFYCLMGNHDYENFTKEQFNALTGGSVPQFSLTFGENALIFLDANYCSDGSVYTPHNVNWIDTVLPKKQLLKLEAVLLDEKTKNAYVFVHQNLDTGVGIEYRIKNAPEIREILEKSGKVKRVIQGHYHPGHDMTIAGIPYHTVPAMCEGYENRYEIMEI